MTTKLWTPKLASGGQLYPCAHCGLPPTPEGHDGCLGTLQGDIKNSCCGHGNDNQAYIQYDGDVGIGEDDGWGNSWIGGIEARIEQKRLVEERNKN